MLLYRNETKDHVTDQNGESWYQVSNHFLFGVLQIFKVLLHYSLSIWCERNIRQSKADRFKCSLKIYIYICSGGGEKTEVYRGRGLQIGD